MKTTEAVGQIIKLVPTQGGYQEALTSVLVRDTKTQWIVRPNGVHYDWRFSKKDGLRVGAMKHEFPAYRIELFKKESGDENN